MFRAVNPQECTAGDFEGGCRPSTHSSLDFPDKTDEKCHTCIRDEVTGLSNQDASLSVLNAAVVGLHCSVCRLFAELMHSERGEN